MRFVEDLWCSALEFFLPSHTRHLFLFSEHTIDLPDCCCLPIRHEPWPGPTLHRYRTLVEHEETLSGMDYLVHCDADMRFVGPIGNEILGELIATVHPGFYHRPLQEFTYERNPRSKACVLPEDGRRYYAGGFQGGRSARYLEAARCLSQHIEEDDRSGIIAVWHDESHWNRYLIDHPPAVELSPSYCYPEGQRLPFTPRLVAINKDHEELRSN